MVRAYEQAMQKSESKVLPRWMSRNGRLLDSVEEHFRALCDQEIARRLNNMDKYSGKKDYLQLILNTVGGRFAEGILHSL
jgi:ATP-dependent protease ClpP protease subunit